MNFGLNIPGGTFKRSLWVPRRKPSQLRSKNSMKKGCGMLRRAKTARRTCIRDTEAPDLGGDNPKPLALCAKTKLLCANKDKNGPRWLKEAQKIVFLTVKKAYFAMQLLLKNSRIVIKNQNITIYCFPNLCRMSIVVYFPQYQMIVVGMCFC